MLSMDDFVALIGQPMDSPVVKDFLQSRRLARSKSDDEYEPERYLTSLADGYDIRHKKGKRARVECIWIRLTPSEGFTPFSGPLSRGMMPDASRAEIQALWGTPSRCGAGDAAGEWPWDRFDSDTVCIHIAYKQGGTGIRMITLMDPAIAPAARK